MEQADMLMEQGDHRSAGAVYQQVMDHDPDNAPAYAGFLKCLIADQRLAEAKEVLEALEDKIRNDKAVQAVATPIELAEHGAKARKSDVEGKRVSERVDLGGGRTY